MKKIVQRLLVVGMVIVAALAGAVIAHGAPFAYIPNQDNSVLVIDQQTNKIVATIDVGSNPVGVAVNAAGTRVYVTHRSIGIVTVIDGATQTIIGSPIPVGTSPQGIVVSPDSSLVYVANEGSETISVINALNNTVIDTITGVPCSSLAINPSGSRLYMTKIINSELRVVDTATRTVIGTPLTLPSHANRRIALNPTGAHLYVTNYSNSLIVVRTADLAVTNIPVGAGIQDIAVHPSGSFIYALDRVAGIVYVIDAGTNTVITSIDLRVADPYADSALAISFNSDGTRAYAPIGYDERIKVIDTATHNVIDTIIGGLAAMSGDLFGPFVAFHRHIWSGTTSFPIKLTGLDGAGKFVKGAGELTGKVIEMRTLGSKYSLLFLSDDLKSSIYLPDVTFLMTDVDGSKGEKFMMSGTGKYYFHDGTEMVSGIANFNGTGTAKRDGPDGSFTQAKMSGTVTGGILQGQYFTGKVKAVLNNVQ